MKNLTKATLLIDVGMEKKKYVKPFLSREEFLTMVTPTITVGDLEHPIVVLKNNDKQDVEVSTYKLIMRDMVSHKDINTDKIRKSINYSIKEYNFHAQVKNKNYQLEKLVLLDSLTQLANRLAFKNALKERISTDKREHRLSGVFYIDLDNFKNINDQYGHHTGDVLLQQVAKRLESNSRMGDVVGRLSGDEFAVLLNFIKKKDDAAFIAEKLCKALKEPYNVLGRKFSVTASIGVVLFPAGMDSPSEILKRADVAMYRAKSMGRDNFQFYDKFLFDSYQQNTKLEQLLPQAIAKNELFLMYQPIVDMREDRIIGFEALLRWHCAKLNKIVMPNEIIPLAENIGLIGKLGGWVIETVLKQNREWRTKNNFNGFITANISAFQLAQKSFFEELQYLVGSKEISFENIMFEISEQSMVDNYHNIKENILNLCNSGFQILIDHFGAGSTNFHHLKTLPVAALKLDRSFISDIGSERSNAIIEGTLAFAKALQLDVIAQGIETKWQKKFLVAAGCTKGQGHYFSKPLMSNEITEMLSQGSAVA